MTILATFFDAWGTTDDAVQAKAIASTYASDGTYADPRSSGVLTGPGAIAEYVAMFSANAPGWTARVVKEDTIGTTTRATIAFGGKGPDGSDMVQHGQYFAEIENDKITRMVGFVGTGEPE